MRSDARSSMKSLGGRRVHEYGLPDLRHEHLRPVAGAVQEDRGICVSSMAAQAAGDAGSDRV
jgi:hypothetical protein